MPTGSFLLPESRADSMAASDSMTILCPQAQGEPESGLRRSCPSGGDFVFGGIGEFQEDFASLQP